MDVNSINKEIETINALAMSLLSLSDAYELPEAVSNIIQDLNSKTEGLNSLI
ncbi:MAG: hypothetical protein RPR97_04870 [Colwellia sp.]|jgi:hypothetical protein